MAKLICQSEGGERSIPGMAKSEANKNWSKTNLGLSSWPVCLFFSVSLRFDSRSLFIRSSLSRRSKVGRREYLWLGLRSNLTLRLALFSVAVWYSVRPLCATKRSNPQINSSTLFLQHAKTAHNGLLKKKTG